MKSKEEIQKRLDKLNRVKQSYEKMNKNDKKLTIVDPYSMCLIAIEELKWALKGDND